jgi:hypothetical protein
VQPDQKSFLNSDSQSLIKQLNLANKKLAAKSDQNLVLQKQLEARDAEIADLKKRLQVGTAWEAPNSQRSSERGSKRIAELE